jgi:hypothetical protein
MKKAAFFRIHRKEFLYFMYTFRGPLNNCKTCRVPYLGLDQSFCRLFWNILWTSIIYYTLLSVSKKTVERRMISQDWFFFIFKKKTNTYLFLFHRIDSRVENKKKLAKTFANVVFMLNSFQGKLTDIICNMKETPACIYVYLKCLHLSLALLRNEPQECQIKI